MELESTNSGPTAKLPILKLGEYEMWVIRIKQYFQIQDYALWEVIENGDSWVSVPQTVQENGTSVTKMSIPATAEEKTNKKNDVKARSLLLMALPNEHQLTFSQYPDAKSMFAAIETRFGGNAATKKTQKTLLKQQYENFSATSAESLDSIFNRLQKIVSRLAILVVWMNKPEVETMSIDDLYNNFKIVEQKVKKTVGGSSGAQNLAFMTAPSTNNTIDTNTASPQVSTASPQVSTASVSNNIMYAFMVENPNGSNVLHQDLEQIHEDDLEAMDLKWKLSLLSVRAKKYYQRTGKKIFINANDIVGYDKSKVECYNCHKLGHFARECRAPRSKESQFRNQDNTRKHGNNKDKSSKEMLAIDCVGFDWSDMAEEQVQTNIDLMAFSDSEVYTDKTCSKTCLKNYETLKKQYDDLLVKLNESEFNANTYKRGLATLEDQIITYKLNEVLFSKEIGVLKREVACKDYEINMLKSEFEKVKQEKDGIEFKIEKFDKTSKDLDQLLGSQITDKSIKGLGYSVVPPPHPLIIDLTSLICLILVLMNSKSLSSKDMVLRIVSKSLMLFVIKKSDNSKENSEESLVEEQVSQDTSSFVESSPNVDKETVFPVNKKVELTKPKNHEKPVKKSVRYAEMYRSQPPRGNQRNWNGQKSNQLGKEFVMYNKACFICGSFNHLQINYDNYQRRGIVSRNNCSRVDAKTTHPSVHRNMSPKAVLLKTGLTPLNTVRPVNTAHPKTAVHSAKSKTHFFKQAQSTAKRPFYKQTTLTRRSVHYYNGRARAVNTARFYTGQVNVVRVKGVNAVKSSAYWVWRPTKPNGASLAFKRHNYIDGMPQQDDKGFVDSGCSRHMTGNIAYLSDFKEFDGGYVAFGGGAYGGRITGKGTLKTDNLDFEDILLKIPRKDNMYSFDMKNIIPKESLTCLVAKATLDESMLWHRRLGHINFKNINKLVKDNLVRGLALKRFENDQTCVACLKGKQHRASSERRNRTLNEAARTMLAYSKLPTTFWAEAVSTACYVQNKFDGKVMKSFLLRFSLSSKAFRVYNTRTRRVEENLHIGFSENKPIIEGNGPKWLFDIDSLTQSMNYVPVTASTISNNSAGTSEENSQDCIVMPIWKDTSYFDSPTKDVENGEPKTADDPQKQVEDGPNSENVEQERFLDDSSTKDVNAVGQHVNTASPDVTTGSLKLNVVGPSVNTASTNEQESTEEEPEVGKCDLKAWVKQISFFNGRFNSIRLYCALLALRPNIIGIEPTSIPKALYDSSWVEAMQEELFQFKLQQVWILVDLPSGKRAIGTKWVFKNKKDERGIMIRNKARLVAQGHRQEEGIDYDKVFAHVARIEAIRLFLAYASFMGFRVYQMDVKSDFLYETIEEEVYVSQPPRFKDPDHPDKVYKVVKALYSLHQTPRAWYETLANYLLGNGFKRGKIDQTLFIKKQKGDILLVQIYVDDIIFGSTNKELCTGFEKLMKDKFQMSSMGE
ncbi:putative ribonuclease H-like domain-containing protein [Tanacetum coccineum]